jgi:hypothetical protein
VVPAPIWVHCRSSRPGLRMRSADRPAVMADVVIVRPGLAVEEDGAAKGIVHNSFVRSHWRIDGRAAHN